MRIRNSLLASLAMTLFVILPAAIFLPLLRPEVMRSPERLALSLLALGILVAAMFLFGIATPSAEVYRDRYRTNGRVWSPWKVLGPGERFVLCRNRFQVQRIDGSLQATSIAKWNTAGRHWRRLEQWFPIVDER